jgi:hypothetical protein
MGRPRKGLHLRPIHLRSLEELLTQAKSLGCCDVSGHVSKRDRWLSDFDY